MKISEKVGMIIKIPLSGGTHAYARIITGKFYAFYNIKTGDDLDSNQILESDIIFILSVSNSGIRSGRWDILDTVPLEPQFLKTPDFFIQDILDPSKIFIYSNGIQKEATLEDCYNLEAMAIWEPEHIENRLEDYFAGKENKWEKSLRLISPLRDPLSKD